MRSNHTAPPIEVFAPLKRAARAIFHDDIRLHRDSDGLRLVLQANGAPPPPPRNAKALEALAREQIAVLGMCQDLTQALDEHGGSRHKLRHLAYVEQQLALDGLGLLNKVPLGVLQLALEQFESLILNWSPQGLACLRSKMAVAVQQRKQNEDESLHVQELPSSGAPAIAEHRLSKDDTDSLDTQAALLAAYDAMDAMDAPTAAAAQSVATKERATELG